MDLYGSDSGGSTVNLLEYAFETSKVLYTFQNTETILIYMLM